MSKTAEHRAQVVICNRKGLHARASAKFVQLAETFASEIDVVCGPERVTGCSMLGLLSLQAGPGTQLEIIAKGNDAKTAVEALSDLITNGFGEELA